MASFQELDWQKLDTFAIVSCRGLASIEPESWDAATEWLSSQNYQRIRLDFKNGISPVVAELGIMLNWEREFGYQLSLTSRNLAALHDGFDFEPPDLGGLVLELTNYESAFLEDAQWSTGFLAIITEHSLRQLALSRRFFALIGLSTSESPIVGKQIEQMRVPYPFPFRELHANRKA